MKIFSPSVALSAGVLVAISSLDGVSSEACSLGSATPKTLTVTSAASNDLARPSDQAACTGGKIPYLKSITVLPSGTGATATDLARVSLGFSKGGTAITDTVADKLKETCDTGLKYKNVGRDGVTTGDVTVTVECAASAAGASATNCALSYVAEWGCYDQLFGATAVDKMFTRTGTPVGAGCMDPSDSCVDRCFKSLKLTATASATSAKLNSAFTPSGCSNKCTELTLTTINSDKMSASGTGLAISLDADGFTVTQTGSKVCTSKYVEGTYTNPFTAKASKTYTRSAVDPTSCDTSSCEAKCTATLAVTAGSDDVTGTSPTVENCTCKPLTAIVDSATTAAGKNGTTTSYAWKVTTTGFEIETKAGTAPVCKATYKEQDKTSGSGTGSKASSGVSINTIWAVAATGAIAVAGAYVMA